MLKSLSDMNTLFVLFWTQPLIATSLFLKMGNGPAPGMMPVSSADGGMNNGGMAMTTRPAMPMGNMQPMRQQMMGMPNQAGNQV